MANFLWEMIIPELKENVEKCQLFLKGYMASIIFLSRIQSGRLVSGCDTPLMAFNSHRFGNQIH
jgi:hypothetical protein